MQASFFAILNNVSLHNNVHFIFWVIKILIGVSNILNGSAFEYKLCSSKDGGGEGVDSHQAQEIHLIDDV